MDNPGRQWVWYERNWEEWMISLRHLLVQAPVVDRGEWQSKREGNDPRFHVRELLNVRIEWNMPPTFDALKQAIKPNLPWAEDHFRERVSGQPLNPGEQFRNWPWYEQGVEEHKPEGKFSHTYMERFWPKWAGWAQENPDSISRWGPAAPHRGIRYDYGDLADVVNLLQAFSMTRQAFLPVWFPEDTGAVHRERVPCTLGYHFQFDGDGAFHCTYFARSIDFVRYLRDDAYMAARLAEWIHYQLLETLEFDSTRLGTLTMNIANLHCFQGDMPRLHREIADEEDEIYGA